MPQTPSNNQWQEWSHHPVTKAWKALIAEDIEAIKAAWANGSYTSETEGATVQANAQAIGQVQALASLMDRITELQEQQPDPSNDGEQA